jgi:hypothetical protein
LVDAVRAVLFEHEESRMIMAVTWLASHEDHPDEEFDFNLRTTVLELLPSARGVSPEDHVREVLRIGAEKLKGKLDSPHMIDTKMRLIKIKKVEFTLVRGRCAQLMGPPRGRHQPSPPEPARGSVGRGAGLALPNEVFRGHCCLKINNSDDNCFRYVLTAWKNGVPQKNAERISNYITNAPAGGRLPQLFRPEFVERGLDFSMLRFPVGIQDLEPFETANDVGIYVYEWHGSHAVAVRRPPVARDPGSEVVLLLDQAHWYLVTNVRSFLAAPDQRKQHFCYRCHGVFWDRHGGAESLSKHLEKVSPNSCLEANDEVLKEYRLLAAGSNVLKFKKFEHQLMHPLAIYADFETYTEDIPPPEEESTKKNKSSVVLQSKMSGVASYGYTVVSKIPEIPSQSVVMHGSGEDFINEVMSIAMKYRWLAKNPKNIIISDAEEAAFAQSTKCYLCGGEDSELGRDHDQLHG